MAQEIYSEYTDLREPFGIDESWLDVSASTSIKGDGMKIAKAVCQYDVLTVELLGEYPSIISASRITGCDRRTIQRQLSGESNTGSPHSLGNLKYIWKYKQ